MGPTPDRGPVEEFAEPRLAQIHIGLQEKHSGETLNPLKGNINR